MELLLNSQNVKVKRNIEQDHYWYDTASKQMLHEKGGRMEFVYDPSQKRSIPKIVDHEELVYGNNYPEIKKWVNENIDKYGISINYDNGKNISISIDNKDFNDIREDLYRSHIVSDYDPRELSWGKR